EDDPHPAFADPLDERVRTDNGAGLLGRVRRRAIEQVRGIGGGLEEVASPIESVEQTLDPAAEGRVGPAGGEEVVESAAGIADLECGDEDVTLGHGAASRSEVSAKSAQERRKKSAGKFGRRAHSPKRSKIQARAYDQRKSADRG